METKRISHSLLACRATHGHVIAVVSQHRVVFRVPREGSNIVQSGGLPESAGQANSHNVPSECHAGNILFSGGLFAEFAARHGAVYAEPDAIPTICVLIVEVEQSRSNFTKVTKHETTKNASGGYGLRPNRMVFRFSKVCATTVILPMLRMMTPDPLHPAHRVKQRMSQNRVSLTITFAFHRASVLLNN